MEPYHADKEEEVLETEMAGAGTDTGGVQAADAEPDNGYQPGGDDQRETSARALQRAVLGKRLEALEGKQLRLQARHFPLRAWANANHTLGTWAGT